jgi:adenylylsulfate reductase subunit B
MPPVIDHEKCTGCGVCEECMGDVIYLKEENGKRFAYARYPDECWYCGSCRQDCPEGAIAIVFPPSMVLV